MSLSSKPTQDFVPVKEIRDGVVMMKDGSMRAVLMTSSVNFALKSEETQNAIILQFQNFLNSLDFSVQIFIQSRHLDIRPYLATLEERYRVKTNDLLKIQIREYIDFIRNFTENSSIMTKGFFVVVPFAQTLIGSKGGGFGGIAGALPGFKKESGPEKDAEKNAGFEESRVQLEQRVSVVEQGLVRCGIRIARLGTEELIEFYYRLFNPGETDKAMKIS